MLHLDSSLTEITKHEDVWKIAEEIGNFQVRIPRLTWSTFQRTSRLRTPQLGDNQVHQPLQREHLIRLLFTSLYEKHLSIEISWTGLILGHTFPKRQIVLSDLLDATVLNGRAKVNSNKPSTIVWCDSQWQISDFGRRPKSTGEKFSCRSINCAEKFMGSRNESTESTNSKNEKRWSQPVIKTPAVRLAYICVFVSSMENAVVFCQGQRCTVKYLCTSCLSVLPTRLALIDSKLHS